MRFDWIDMLFFGSTSILLAGVLSYMLTLVGIGFIGIVVACIIRKKHEGSLFL